MKLLLPIFIVIVCFTRSLSAQDVVKMNEANQSLTYDQAISMYSELAKEHPKHCKLFTEGLTDCGRPLHLFVISSDGTFDPETARKNNKRIILINNGIHPGEPDGIDASVRLAQDYLDDKKGVPENVVICIIPVFNIDGSLNRGCCSRANQNGPEAYGFRSNGKNLDLNRDFMKTDAENTRSFIKIFRKWDPDVFVDTHVSNGADYQYTITLISTQHNKLGGPVGEYIKNKMTPTLFEMMKKSGQEMSTYVNTSKYDDNPQKGIYGFMEIPRFASGYAALFHCLSFVSETHMLKPFASRVNATQTFLENVINYTSENATGIAKVRRKAKELIATQNEFTLDWTIDSTKFDSINFNGFEAEYRKSKVTDQEQLYYNRQKPYSRLIRFYDHYVPKTIVTKPAFYVVPQAWSEVIERLQLNQVTMTRFENDTTINVHSYTINDYKTSSEPYEGRYLHNSTTLTESEKQIRYYKGDYLVPVNQECNRYIVETLEPTGPDSWFNWGFFDGILQQKEWFSSYVFDGMAEKLLNDNADLKSEFEKKKSENKEFATSSFEQLYFIYKHSPNFEDLRRYPIAKIK